MPEESSEDRSDVAGHGRVSLPEIPDAVGVEPLLAALLHCATFLDLSSADVVDDAAATDVLEHVGLYVQRLGPERQSEIGEQLQRLKRHAEEAGWSEPVIVFIDEFLYSCGIGEDVAD